MMKLTWKQAVVTMAGVGCLTGDLGSGGSFLQFITPTEASASSANTPEKEDSKSTVVHIVEHRSGTGEGDVLTGVDHFIFTAKDASKEEGSASLPTEEDFYLGVTTYCRPFDLRILNSSDEYVIMTYGLYATDRISKIGIGPGERAVNEIDEAGDYIISDDEERFADYFIVRECGNLSEYHNE